MSRSRAVMRETPARPIDHTERVSFMISRPERVTIAEIAERYDRSVVTIRQHWTKWAEWPDPVGKRGRWHEYDGAVVDAVVRARLERVQPEKTGDPDDLLDARAIAEYAGLAWGTIRADISRGRIGEPDDVDAGGVSRWRRATVDRVLAGRVVRGRASTFRVAK